MYELMKWSDISWFEWCTDLAMNGSKLPKVCKNIIRLHRYEAYLDCPKEVNWDNVDVLITVGNRCVNEVLCRKVPDIGSRTRIMEIANGVDLEKFRFVDRPRGKNIAFVGNLRLVKNPMFALQCMQKLNSIDREYKLFFAGWIPKVDEFVEQYLRHMVESLGLKSVVFFDGWQKDISSWLADKHYIVSTSVIESQGMGILEGMANGLKPVVHNFPGAEQTFAQEFLFNTAEDFCKQILSAEYEPRRYRLFVEERYLLQMQLKRVNKVLTGLERSCTPQQYWADGVAARGRQVQSVQQPDARPGENCSKSIQIGL
jgi:glycosyltransferase involved in cell wall biosynthesis